MGNNHETLRRAKLGLAAKYEETDGQVDRHIMGDGQTGGETMDTFSILSTAVAIMRTIKLILICRKVIIL